MWVCVEAGGPTFLALSTSTRVLVCARCLYPDGQGWFNGKALARTISNSRTTFPGRLARNAHQAILAQEKPVGLLLRSQLKVSPIDWSLALGRALGAKAAHACEGVSIRAGPSTQMLGESRMTPMTARPPRRSATIRQPPARVVQPVLTP